MLKLLIKLLKPYMSVVYVRIIGRLLADNERLQQEWVTRYQAMEREMWYWKDRYMDEIVYPEDPKKL